MTGITNKVSRFIVLFIIFMLPFGFVVMLRYIVNRYCNKGLQ